MGIYLYARFSYDILTPEQGCEILRQWKGVELAPENLVAYNTMTSETEEEIYTQDWVWDASLIAWCFGYNLATVCKLSPHTDPAIMSFLENHGGYHGQEVGHLPGTMIEEFSRRFMNGVKVIDVYWA